MSDAVLDDEELARRLLEADRALTAAILGAQTAAAKAEQVRAILKLVTASHARLRRERDELRALSGKGAA